MQLIGVTGKTARDRCFTRLPVHTIPEARQDEFLRYTYILGYHMSLVCYKNGERHVKSVSEGTKFETKS
jgi:hypothetical protein